MTVDSKKKILRGIIDSMLIVLFLGLLGMPISFLGLGTFVPSGAEIEVLGKKDSNIDTVKSSETTPTPSGRIYIDNGLPPASEFMYSVSEDNEETTEAIEATELLLEE